MMIQNYSIMNVIAYSIRRHCGLDPQSPERRDNLFFRRWRMFLRHDGRGGVHTILNDKK